MTFSAEETERLAELVASLKTSTRDVILVIADYEPNGDANLQVMSSHGDRDDAIDQMLHIVEMELGPDADQDDDDDQAELPLEKVTLQ